MKFKKALWVGGVMAAVVVVSGIGQGLIGEFDSSVASFSCESPAVTKVAQKQMTSYLVEVTFLGQLGLPDTVAKFPQGAIQFAMVGDDMPAFWKLYDQVSADGAPYATQYKAVMTFAQHQIASVLTFDGWGQIDGVAHNHNIKPCSAVVTNKGNGTSIPIHYSVTKGQDGSIMVRSNPIKDFQG